MKKNNLASSEIHIIKKSRKTKMEKAIAVHFLRRNYFVNNIKKKLIYLNNLKKKKKKFPKLNNRCTILILILLKKFLVKVGQNARFNSLNSNRFYINQDDVVNSYIFKKLFNNSEEIFKQRNNVFFMIQKKIKKKNVDKDREKIFRKWYYVKNFYFKKRNALWMDENSIPRKCSEKKKLYTRYKIKLISNLEDKINSNTYR